MAPSGSPKSSPSRSAQERRAAQRETLREQRQAEQRRQRTVRTVVIAAITVVALVILSGIGLLIYKSMQPEGPVAVPAGMSEDQPYLSLGAPEDSGKPVLELHLDFMCPHCGTFEEINGQDVAEMVEKEEVTLHLVPRNALDTASSSGDYSSRAASALAAVYEEDPAAALTFMQLMFTNQPAEGSEGLSDEEIWGYAKEAGASEAVQPKIEDGAYVRWVREVADPYASEVASGTPYVEIDGTKFEDWTTEGALAEAVQAATGEEAASDGGK